MNGMLSGQVAVVTGAGRGLGRSHALTLAKHGASILVNDLGCAVDGTDSSISPAEEVVDLIRQNGGRAELSAHDVSNWSQSGQMIEQAIDCFGDLHVLVNNAGILRDRSFANMTELEWDDVIRVHLKGHAAPSHHAFNWWKSRSKAGCDIKASIVNTTSVAGLYPHFGQANYCAAKAAIISLSQVMAVEGARFGVRSNAIAPSARSRMFEAPPLPQEGRDPLDPTNVSRLIAWLSRSDCSISGQAYHVLGDFLSVFQLSSPIHTIEKDFSTDEEAMGDVLNQNTVLIGDIEAFIEQRFGSA